MFKWVVVLILELKWARDAHTSDEINIMSIIFRLRLNGWLTLSLIDGRFGYQKNGSLV